MGLSYLLTAGMLAGIVLIGLSSRPRSKLSNFALLALAILGPAVYYATL